jgi:DNA repair exonuclease SbcCD ATPase subunit
VSDTDVVLRQYQDQVSTYERAISDNNTEIAKLEAQDLRAALVTLQGNLDTLTQQIGDIEVTAHSADEDEYVCQYLVTAFGLGGIRSYMMDSILSYINERLQVYCQHLFDGGVSVELSPLHEQKTKAVVEKISLVVTTAGGYYDTSSGGERRKVDVALFLAFRDLNRMMNPVQVNLEAYDEILSFLDGEAASRVVQLLVADQSVETKILITHRADVPIIGPHKIVKAVKQLGVTRYVTL